MGYNLFSLKNQILKKAVLKSSSMLFREKKKGETGESELARGLNSCS